MHLWIHVIHLPIFVRVAALALGKSYTSTIIPVSVIPNDMGKIDTVNPIL